MDDVGHFGDIDSRGPPTNQHGANSSPDMTLGIAANNIDTGIDTDANPDDTEGGLSGAPPGDCSEGEDEGSDAAMTTDEMDVDGATPDCEGHKTAPPFKAGCVWSRADYSCSNDVVFMAFFALYSRSPHSWHDDWWRQSPEWTMPLADSFDFLEALELPECTPEELSISFSHLRDWFHDQLSSLDQQAFPRRGQELAPVCRILELLFGSIHGPCIKQCLSCTGCGAISQTSHDFPFLALSSLRTVPVNKPRET